MHAQSSLPLDHSDELAHITGGMPNYSCAPCMQNKVAVSCTRLSIGLATVVGEVDYSNNATLTSVNQSTHHTVDNNLQYWRSSLILIQFKQ